MKICNKCDISKDKSEFYIGYNYCKSCFKEQKRKYYDENKEKIKEYQNKWYKDNIDKYKEDKKKYKEENKEKIKKNAKKYYKENRKKIIKIMSIYIKNRLVNDPVYKFKFGIRSLIYQSFNNKGYKKNSKTAKILGCTYEELHHHLALSFYAKYGRLRQVTDDIHIDHIYPLAAATTEEELIQLNHYTNLQWLLAEDNLAKSDKIDHEIS